MLTENEIRVLIVKRVMAACERCNGHFINHVEGQIRGLLATLTDGKKIDLIDDADIRHIFDVAGIPWEDRADGAEPVRFRVAAFPVESISFFHF